MRNTIRVFFGGILVFIWFIIFSSVSLVFIMVMIVYIVSDNFMCFSSPIAMLWGLAKLIGGRAPSGHRQSWWADGVPVMF